MSESPAPIPRFAVRALDDTGRTLARYTDVIAAGEVQGDIKITLPHQLARRVTHLRIDGQKTAAGVLLLDGRTTVKTVGLVAQAEAANLPLVGSAYYLERALPPGTQIIRESLEGLITESPEVIIYARDGSHGMTHTGDEENRNLDAWVRQGGTLIQFAGAHPPPLPPAPLRLSNRSLGGGHVMGSTLSSGCL